MVRRYQNSRPYWPWMCTMAMKKLYKFPPHGIWIWYWVCTIGFLLFQLWHGMQVSTSACGAWRSDWYFLLFSTWYELLLHGLSESQQGVSWSDFWVSKSLFRVSQSGVRVSQSPLQSFTIRFPSFTMQVSQYDLQVSEYNLQVSQSKFQNPFSTFRNPIAKFHNPALMFTKVSSRFPLNFLMVHCIFLQVPFSACSKFLQGFFPCFLRVCFTVSWCVSLTISLRVSFGFLARFLLSFLLVSWRFLSGTHFFDSFPRSRPATAEPQTLFSRP